MSNGKRIAVILTKALVGGYGVDCFLMGATKAGVIRIVWTVVLAVLSGIFSGTATVVSQLPNSISWLAIVFTILAGLVSIVAFARNIYFLVTGLLMFKKSAEEIEALY